MLRQILCAPSVVFTKCASLLKSILNYSAQKLLLPVCFPIDDKKIERFGVVRGLRLLAASFLSSGMSLQANTSPLLLVSLQDSSPSVSRAAFLCVDALLNKNQYDSDEDEIFLFQHVFERKDDILADPIVLNDLVPQICKTRPTCHELVVETAESSQRWDDSTAQFKLLELLKDTKQAVLRKTFQPLLCRLLSRGDESANVRLLIDILFGRTKLKVFDESIKSILFDILQGHSSFAIMCVLRCVGTTLHKALRTEKSREIMSESPMNLHLRSDVPLEIKSAAMDALRRFPLSVDGVRGLSLNVKLQENSVARMLATTEAPRRTDIRPASELVSVILSCVRRVRREA